MTTKEYKKLQKLGLKYYQEQSLPEVMQEFTLSSILNQNGKLKKMGLPIYGLSLCPANFASLSNQCGFHGACLLTCLFFSGINNMLKNISAFAEGGELPDAIKKCIRRQFLFDHNKEFFYQKLGLEISSLHALFGDDLKIRMNIFSDIDFTDFITSFNQVQFYDYTKDWNRTELPNYSLTFSDSEKTSTSAIVKKLESGNNVAMVFEGNKLPDSWQGYQVLNGDLSDDRVSDLKGCIVGLTEKRVLGKKQENKKFFNKVES